MYKFIEWGSIVPEPEGISGHVDHRRKGNQKAEKYWKVTSARDGRDPYPGGCEPSCCDVPSFLDRPSHSES